MTDEELDKKVLDYLRSNMLQVGLIGFLSYRFGEPEWRIKEALNRLLSRDSL